MNITGAFRTFISHKGQAVAKNNWMSTENGLLRDVTTLFRVNGRLAQGLLLNKINRWARDNEANCVPNCMQMCCRSIRNTAIVAVTDTSPKITV